MTFRAASGGIGKVRSGHRMSGAGGAAAASFSATLLSTLVPEVFTGSSTPTFTRATTAYVSDWEALLKQCVSGEARFSGARRVENTIAASNVPTGSWGLSSVTDNGTIAGVGPAGEDARQYTTTAGSGGINKASSHTISATRTFTATALVRLVSGSTALTITTMGGNAIGTTSIALTTAWRILSFTETGNSNFAQFNFTVTGTLGGQFQIIWVQYEDVSGQSVTTFGGYVSKGVLSAPYHGANVDGVKYFTTQNGNTVASNLITEATGAAISSATLLGYQAEGARTNYALQSQTFDNANWTKNNTTVSADQYTAPDGTTTVDKIIASAGNTTHYAVTTVATSAGVTTVSCYLRYVNNQWVTLYFNDGTTNMTANFDLLNGVVGSKAGGVTSSKITATAISGVYRCEITATTIVNGATNLVVALQNSDTIELGAWVAAGTEAVGAWGMQVEVGSFASSYIPTTTVAVTRNGDALSYSAASNINNVTGTCYMEMAVPQAAAAIGNLLAFSDAALNKQVFNVNAATVSAYDGTNNPSWTFTVGGGTVRKCASSWGSSAWKFAGDGSYKTPDGTFNNNLGITTIGVGWGIGAFQLQGNIRNLALYSTAKTGAELAALTA